MAVPTIHRHNYVIKDLETASVTLSPQTATVVRQIDDLVLKVSPLLLTIVIFLSLSPGLADLLSLGRMRSSFMA